MIDAGSAGWSVPRVRQPHFSSHSGEQTGGLAVQLSEATVDAWCIFDNTGSGSAAGNALDLRARLGAA